MMTPAELRSALAEGLLDLCEPETRALVARVLGHEPSTARPAATAATRSGPPPAKPSSAVAARRYPHARFMGYAPDGAEKWDANGVRFKVLPAGSVNLKEKK